MALSSDRNPGSPKSVPAGAVLSGGIAAAPHHEWLKVMTLLPQLPKLWASVRALERQIAELMRQKQVKRIADDGRQGNSQLFCRTVIRSFWLTGSSRSKVTKRSSASRTYRSMRSFFRAIFRIIPVMPGVLICEAMAQVGAIFAHTHPRRYER